MIRRIGNVFVLDTPNTTYAFGVIPSGQLEHLYYGEKISIDSEEEAAVLAEKRLCLPGNTVAYSAEHSNFSLEVIRLEASGAGKGDVREPMIEVTHADGSYTSDFVFADAKITQHACLSANFTSVSARVPFVVAIITVSKSFSRSGRTTCVSGSPKRQLYSITFGPFGVSIRPK